MASEEQINNQQRLNDLREEELSYIQESEAFIASTISKSAQLADTIKSQLASVREKTTLDQKVLQFSKQNVDVLTKLKVDYQDISKVDKDRKSILDQIQKNNNVINAQGKTLSKEVKDQAKAFVEQEKALSDQQKLLAEKIDKQEQLEKLIKSQEEAGKKIDIADRALLKNAQESARLQRLKVAGIQSELLSAGQLVDPLAISLALLEDQNTQLDKAAGYLDEEEKAIRNVIKSQALFNLTLGTAEGLMKKLGLESAAISLGLDEGKIAAEELANELSNGGEKSLGLFDQFKVLGAGIMGTFKGMAKGLKTTVLALAIGKLFGKIIGGLASPVTNFIKDLKSKFTEGISYLKNQFFSLQSYIDDANVGEAFLRQLSEDTASIATNIGVSTKNARELVTQAGKVSASVGLLPEELAKTTSELQQAFGTTQKFSDDTVKTMGQLTNLFGLTNEEASEFVKLSQLSGQEASDTTLTLKTQIQALKERENIAVSEKEIMQEIAKSSAAQQLTFRGSSKSLAEAAFHAKKMGLSLAQTEAIGSNLLNFESSIAAEMEAELMLGRDLNLERARSAALEGDLATVAKEVAGQIGSAAEFGKMNVLQQKALADSIGVSRDELADMLKTQELLAGTGFDEMSDAQEQFKKLLKETGSEEAALAKMREMGASDALADQIRSVNLQEKRRQEEREIAEAQGELAKQTLKLFSAFNKVFASVKRLKAVVVDQMKPFFDQFGGLIGDGAGELENRLVPAAEKLGKFLNEIGLKVLEVVGSIDLDKLIGDVKAFFTDVKEKATAIMDFFKNSALGQLLTGGGAATALSIAPVAIKGLGKGLFQKGTKMNPMIVKQSDTGIFGDAMGKALGKRNTSLLKGLKGLSKVTGGKKTVVGRALRNVAAMAGKRSSIGAQVMKSAKGALGKVGGKTLGAVGSVAKGIGGKTLGAVGSVAKGVGGKALGALGKIGVKGLVKAIPGVGLIATAGMAAVDAFKGFKNAGEIFDKKVGESVSTGEKLAAGAASAVSGLTFGLLDTKATAKAFKSAGVATKKFFKDMGSKTKDAAKKFGAFTKDIGSDLKESFSKGTEIAKEKLSNLKDVASERFADMKEKAADAFSGAKAFAGDIFSDLKEGNYSEAFDKIKTKIVEKFTEIKSRISDIFANLLEPIKERIKGPINFTIGSINSMIEKVNSALSFEIEETMLTPAFGFETNIPTIPMLAKGGIVENPTLAVLGEAGPEAVIPLDKLSSTVNGTIESSPQNVDELKQELQELKQIMSGFVEQMGQVVNRPITVELNGNKVGQALGQNSYRIQ